MSLSNRRRGRVSPPPAKYDPEWENQLRRAFEESILKPDDFTNSYPFNSPYLSGGRIEVTQISNVTGGWSNVTGEYTKTSPHDEESETDGSHHWVMRQWRPPSYCGTAYYASPSRLPESVSVYPNVSGFRLDYDNLAPWSSYDAIADALASTDTKICFQALVGYSAQATLMGGAVSRVDDEMLAETKSYWQMSLADLRDGVASHALSIANYQYVSNNASGSLLPDQGILDVTSPLEAVDNPGAYCTTIRINATAADKYLYSTGVDTWAEGAITAFGRSLLDDSAATNGRDTLGASSGIWPATLGGTGQSSFTVGDLLYASTTTALSKLAAGTSGYVLTSGGAGVAPSWAAASAGVTGSGTANQVAYWSGTSALTGDADLVFNGTQLLTTGLFVGALTGTPARALEVRSTSAQIRASYDANSYLEITGGGASAAHIKILNSGLPGPGGTFIGRWTDAGASQPVAIGDLTVLAATSGLIAIGNAASPGAQDATCLGRAAAVGAAGTSGLACGAASSVTGARGTACGGAAVAGGNYSKAFGFFSVANNASEFVCGADTYTTTDVYFGSGYTSTAPVAWTLHGTNGSGTDIAGADLSLAPGRPTGAGNPGNLLIKFAPAGASGTTLRTLATYADWRIGGLIIGTSGASARALEVRSTSAQIRASYDATFYWERGCASDGANKWVTNSTSVGTTELEATRTITGAVTDGYVAGLLLDPGYSGAYTVTRHNYLDCQDVSLAASAALTDACLVRFDAAAGTHKATVGATTKSTPGGVDAWVKININGTLYYVPAYTSTTA